MNRVRFFESSVELVIQHSMRTNEEILTVRQSDSRRQSPLSSLPSARIRCINPSTIHQNLKTNAASYIYLTMAALPTMMEMSPLSAEAGRIVVVSSLTGVMGMPHVAPYAAAKHAYDLYLFSFVDYAYPAPFTFICSQ